MVNIRLSDVFVEHKKKELLATSFGKSNTRWYALVALNLIDKASNRPIAEWFYLVVCSESYLQKPFKRGPILDKKYIVVQDHFDIEAVNKIAQQKAAKIKADNWGAFYYQMKKEFLHED